MAGVIACLVLLSWVTGEWMVGALGYGYVPMAPTSAAAILVLSLSVFSCIHRPDTKGSTALGWFSAVLTAAICAANIVLHASGAEQLISEKFAPAAVQAGGQTVGVMSLLTILVLLLFAVALLLEIRPFRKSRAYRQAASAFALVGGLISLWVVLGYVLGTPVLYGTGMVPMALSTGFSLTLLGLGLAYNAAPGVWPMSRVLPDRSGERSKWTARGPVVAFLLLFAAVAAVGGVHLATQQMNMRGAAMAELGAVADLKVQDIANWRRERLSDARFLANAVFVARDLRGFLSNPADEAIRAEVLNWMTLIKGGDRYEKVAVFDAGGNERLSIPASPGPPDGDLRSLATAALRDNTVGMTDLNSGAGGEPHLYLTAPVRAPGADSAAAPPSAVILMRIDPRRFLFPLIQSWPSPSATAETLLVRREENDIVYLNELRHRKGPAMELRLPLHRTDLPEAMAVQKKRGAVEGVDYRGVPVVAVLKRVPDTPWFLVTKVDQTEIYAEPRAQGLQAGAMLILLILAAGMGIVALWRQRNLEYFQETLAREEKQRALAQRFEHLMRQASDQILLTDKQGKIVEANEQAIRAYGLTIGELRETEPGALRAPEEQAGFGRKMEELAQKGSVRYETMHRRADSSVFPVEVSARVVDIGGAEHRLFIIRDITERHEREREIDRLNRLYAALSHVNQAIVRCRTRWEMLDGVCAALVEQGGLQVSWIGRHDPQNLTITPQAWRCSGGAAMPDTVLAADAVPMGQSPTAAAAIREGRPAVCQDLAAAE